MSIRSKVIGLVGIAVAAIAMSGCYKATFYDAQTELAREHDRWTDFFIFGLVGTEDIDVSEFCPNGNVARVRTGGNVGTWLVSGITFGIYTPRKVYVACSVEKTANAEFQVEEDWTGRPVRFVRVHDGATAQLESVSEGVFVSRMPQEVRP